MNQPTTERTVLDVQLLECVRVYVSLSLKLVQPAIVVWLLYVCTNESKQSASQPVSQRTNVASDSIDNFYPTLPYNRIHVHAHICWRKGACIVSVAVDLKNGNPLLVIVRSLIRSDVRGVFVCALFFGECLKTEWYEYRVLCGAVITIWYFRCIWCRDNPPMLVLMMMMIIIRIVIIKCSEDSNSQRTHSFAFING